MDFSTVINNIQFKATIKIISLVFSAFYKCQLHMMSWNWVVSSGEQSNMR